MGKILGRYVMPHTSMLVPLIGKENIKEHAMETIMGINAIGQDIAKKKPDTIIILSPHGQTFSDCFHVPVDKKFTGELQQTRNFVPLSFDNNVSLAQKIIVTAMRNGINSDAISLKELRSYGMNKRLDYSVSVPLYMLHYYYEGYKVVQVFVTNESRVVHYEFGKALRTAVKKSDSDVVIIASAELSHRHESEIGDAPYGYSPFAAEYDNEVIDALNDSDATRLFSIDLNLKKAAWDCGYDALCVLLGTIDGFKLKSMVHSYEHPFGIGMFCASLSRSKEIHPNFLEDYKKQAEEKTKAIQKNESDPVKLARKAIYGSLNGAAVPIDYEALPLYMSEKPCGVYIGIQVDGEWRGCKGSLDPSSETLAEEIVGAAKLAAFGDPRFSVVTLSELEKATITVYFILDRIEVDKKHPERLDPATNGLFVSSSMGKGGFVLPGMPEILTGEEQLRAAKKMGNFHLWSDHRYKVYEVKTAIFR